MIESSQKRFKDLEKSNTALRKELADAKAAQEAANCRANEAEERANAAESSLALEKDVAKAEVDAFKEAVEQLRKEKEDVTEQLEGVAFEAMMKERCSLMRQLLAGEQTCWTPDKWIKEYESMEAGLPLSSDEESDDDQAAAEAGVVEESAGKAGGDEAPSVD